MIHWAVPHSKLEMIYFRTCQLAKQTNLIILSVELYNLPKWIIDDLVFVEIFYHLSTSSSNTRFVTAPMIYKQDRGRSQNCVRIMDGTLLGGTIPS